MDEFVTVRVVRRREGREIPVADGMFRLPVTLGRGPANDIRLAEDGSGGESAPERVSRAHATLKAEGGRIVVRDHSSNGTIVRGRRLRFDEVAEIGERGQFEIVDYRIEVTREVKHLHARPVLEAIVSTRGSGGVVEQGRVPIGELMLVCVRRDGRMKVEGVPLQVDTANLFGRYRLDGAEPLLVALALEGAGFLFASPEGQALGATLNGSNLASARVRLPPLSSVTLRDVRLDVLEPGHRALRCVNARCELLNEEHRQGNCRFCGFRLTEAASLAATPAGSPARASGAGLR